MNDDQDLLRRYVAQKSREALGEIVRRHQDMVYSSALRQVKDRHLAEDVAQAVFLVLAEKAGAIRPGSVLGGWLFTVTHRAALHALRKVRTQRRHERAAAKVDEPMKNSDASVDWDQISVVLDATLAELSSIERDAVILRYFENKSFAEIGAKMGLTAEAARKRVARSLDRLRGRLAGRGVSVASAMMLAAAISAHAVSPAPAAVAIGVSSGATGIAKGVLRMMGWTNVKAAVAVAAVAALGLIGLTGLILTTPLLAQQNTPANTAANIPVNNPAPQPNQTNSDAIAPAPLGFFETINHSAPRHIVAFDLHDVRSGGTFGGRPGHPAKSDKSVHIIQSDNGVQCEVDEAGLRTVSELQPGGEKVIYDDKAKIATVYPGIEPRIFDPSSDQAMAEPTIWQQYSAILADSTTNDDGSEQVDGRELERHTYAREASGMGTTVLPGRKITIWTDPRTGAIVQATESSKFEPVQSKWVEDYSHFELNPKLDGDPLSLDPPADYKVVTPANYPSISRRFVKEPVTAVAEALQSAAPDSDSAFPADLNSLAGFVSLDASDVEELGPIDPTTPQVGSNTGGALPVSRWFAHVNLGRALGALPPQSWGYPGAGKKRGGGSELVFWCGTPAGYQGIYDDLSVKDLPGPGPAGNTPAK